MRKICAVITNQAHYSRGKLIFDELKNNKNIELQMVVAGSALLDKYGDLSKIIERDGFEVKSKITMLVEGSSPSSMAKTTGLGLLEFSTAFENLKPDLVLIRGDRYEILAAAIASSYLNIPVAHIEGGDISGTIDESVRHAVTKLSHIHLTTNELSKDRVIGMGEDPENVFNVGSPDIEVLSKQDLSFKPNQLWESGIKGVGSKPDISKGFLFLIQHPVTTEYSSARDNMEETLQAIDELKHPTICIWPNVDAGADMVSKAIRIHREKNNPDNLHLFRYLPPELFSKMLNNALCIVGNSSAGVKESSYLGTPSVNIGTRQKGRLRADNVIDTKYTCKSIKRAIMQQLEHGPYEPSKMYYRKDTSKKIAEILAHSNPNIQKTLFDK